MISAILNVELMMKVVAEVVFDLSELLQMREQHP